MSTRAAISKLLNPELWVKIWDFEFNYPEFILLSKTTGIKRDDKGSYVFIDGKRRGIEQGFYSSRDIKRILWPGIDE